MVKKVTLEDFKAGKADEIFQKIANKTSAELNQALVLPHGPLPKNQATYDFEYIAKQCLYHRDRVEFTIEDNNIFCTIEGKRFNLFQIVKEMDARFIEFSQEDMDACVIATQNGGLFKDKDMKPEHEIREMDVEGLYEDVHYAQMIALTNYTYDMCDAYVSLILGSLENKMFLGNIAQTIIGVGLICSAMSNLPNTKQYTYQSDPGILTQESLKARLASIHCAAKTTKEAGFNSTSKDNAVWIHGTKTLFHDVIGKDISLISIIPWEKEVLLPPTQMKWEGHQEVDGTHYFIARPVMTPKGLTKAQNTMGMPTEELNQCLNDLAELEVRPKTLRFSEFKERHNEKKAAKKAKLLLNNNTLSNTERLEQIRKTGGDLFLTTRKKVQLK